MASIIEFLEARITEDEHVARAATAGPWKWDEDQAIDESFLYAPGDVAVIVGYGMHTQGFLECSDEDRTHIARHDPARVLAECAAKQAIVESFKNLAAEAKQTHDDPLDDIALESMVGATRMVLIALAFVYRGHPDYLQEWAA